MKCPNLKCDFKSETFNGDYFGLTQEVLAEIRGRIRSGEYNKQPLLEHITYYDFLCLYDGSDKEDWFPFFEVKRDGIWLKILPEKEESQLSPKLRKDLFDHPNPVLRFPCTLQELEQFNEEFMPEDMIHSMTQKLKELRPTWL